MLRPSRSRRLLAEAIGTGLLLATVVGSGIMGANLAGGNMALALLANTLPTGAIMVVLILIFGPVSGAHFNPAVSLVFAMRGELPLRDLPPYVTVQVAGAVAGVWLAHAMFELPVWQLSTTVRSGSGQWLAESVRASACCLRYSDAWRWLRPRLPMRSGCSSPRPIGSPLRRRLPIRPSQSRGA